jgi:hypothetical protein
MPPTAKQKRVAKEISDRFGVDLPKSETSDAYSKYIGKYIDDLKTELQFESVIDAAMYECHLDEIDMRRDW